MLMYFLTFTDQNPKNF